MRREIQAFRQLDRQLFNLTENQNVHNYVAYIWSKLKQGGRWECWNMRAPLYHELTLTRLAPPAHFSGCFLFVSWGVWVDTSTPPVYQSFYHLTTAMSPFERKQEVPNHTQTPAGASGGSELGMLTCLADLNDLTRYRIHFRLHRLTLSMCFP